MTEPRFSSARITDDGLATGWTDVPAEGDQETLQLSLIVQRDDGSEVRFGARWTRDAEDSPSVFAFDSRTVQERTHEAAETAIHRDGGEVQILFPRPWIDALVDSHELDAAVSVATVDGIDGPSAQVDLDPED